MGNLIMEKQFTLKISRPSDKDIDSGGFPATAAGIPPTITAQASVQPITGRDLEAIDRGERHKRHVLILTRCELLIHDFFTFDGDSFQVQTVERWGKHFECVARKIEAVAVS